MDGPTWTQTKVAINQVLSAGDDLNVLLALSLEAHEDHNSEMGDNSVLLLDSFEIYREKINISLLQSQPDI